ncbi:MAG TPA: hypothetical protein VFM28_07585 [Nitrososphaeraceae archaeon]|jgi:hypothetical protein|nr:hypothetical protein [Nitrososphaeraceae archaeon]
MNRFKIELGRLLFIITITIITIPILVDEESIIMAQDQEQGVTPIDPENVTNQTLQGYPTEDKNMSTGIEINK